MTEAARNIQKVHRTERKDAQPQWREKPEELAALRVVNRLLAIEEEPSKCQRSAPEYVTTDFVDELNLPGQRSMTRGIGQYIAKAEMRSKQPITTVYVPPHVARAETGHKGSLIIVENEVCLGGMSDVRMVFDVLVKVADGHPRISRRIIEPMASLTEDSADRARPRHKEHLLRKSLATLDVDASGHLSMEEIVTASELVGLRFEKRQLANELLLTEAMGDNGTFELHEIDAVVKQQQILTEAGFEQLDRPLLFDVLPLVARTFEAHIAIEKCFRDAKDREERFEQQRMKERRMALNGRQPGQGRLRHLATLNRASNLFLPPLGGSQRPNPLSTAVPGTRKQQARSRLLEPTASTRRISTATDESQARAANGPALRAAISHPNLARKPLPPVRTLTATTSMRGFPPVLSSTGLIAALPVQTHAERMEVFDRSRRSADPLSTRIAVRPRTPWSPGRTRGREFEGQGEPL